MSVERVVVSQNVLVTRSSPRFITPVGSYGSKNITTCLLLQFKFPQLPLQIRFRGKIKPTGTVRVLASDNQPVSGNS